MHVWAEYGFVQGPNACHECRVDAVGATLIDISRISDGKKHYLYRMQWDQMVKSGTIRATEAALLAATTRTNSAKVPDAPR